jgi:hypothetical protein
MFLRDVSLAFIVYFLSLACPCKKKKSARCDWHFYARSSLIGDRFEIAVRPSDCFCEWINFVFENWYCVLRKHLNFGLKSDENSIQREILYVFLPRHLERSALNIYVQRAFSAVLTLFDIMIHNWHFPYFSEHEYFTVNSDLSNTPDDYRGFLFWLIIKQSFFPSEFIGLHV